jgi:hypothetical protein
MATDPRQGEILRDAPGLLVQAIENAPIEERTDPGLLKELIVRKCSGLFRKRAGRRPLVLPIVIEV